MVKVHVFNAGPAKLPDSVLKQIQSGLLDWADTGMSVLEVSHRSKEFTQLLNDTTLHLRSILDIPDNYRVLYLHGGASGMFSAIPLNLIKGHGEVVDYLVTGNWSKNAAKEAEKYAKVNYVVPVPSQYTGLPAPRDMVFTPGARYVYYCDNETVNGVEFPEVPSVPSGTTLVCDMSSNFLSRPVDVSKFGVIFGGVQKNIAPAGLALMIIREDLISTDRLHIVPKVWDFKVQDAANSCANTPNVFSIYTTNLVLQHLQQAGGLKHFAEISDEKARLLYTTIEDSNGFYFCQVEKDARSRMNVTFSMSNAELDSDFLKGATSHNIAGIKGHRSVGGYRASLYNAVTLESVTALTDYMKSFQKEHHA